MEYYTNDLSIDFLDGTIFSKNNFVIIIARFVDTLPKNNKLLDRFDNVYYQYLRDNNNIFYMTTYDYIWRWDTDGFWSSEYHPVLGKIFENQVFRKFYLKKYDNSNSLIPLKKTYDRLRRLFVKIGLIKSRYEDLFQDAAMPIEKCEEFYKWFEKNISIYPLWICPINNSRNDNSYPLLHLKEDVIVDVGFYNRKKLNEDLEMGYYTKLFEKKMVDMGITKGLYAESFINEEDFWKQFDKDNYMKIKSKYDPNSIFPDLYFKSIN